MAKVTIPGTVYDLRQLGSAEFQPLAFARLDEDGDALGAGIHEAALIQVIIDRSRELWKIIPCAETANAISRMEMALTAVTEALSGSELRQLLNDGASWSVLDRGHAYDVPHFGGEGLSRIVFVKRSGGAVAYPQEWPGLQTQEAMRALIDRLEFRAALSDVPKWAEAAEEVRLALYEYEARAWRRKQEGKNHKQPAHDDGARSKPWRGDGLYVDAPFGADGIEQRPIGPDGHIVTGMQETS